jgi:ferredoxin-thioredoxin reductase catalytic chain
MVNEQGVSKQKVDALYEKLEKDAESGGYHLNPDVEFTKELVEGLIVNERRYGYQSCPCRLAGGTKNEDLDIICPCDYRDADISEYEACYCGLYVSRDIVAGKKQVTSIPERRPVEAARHIAQTASGVATLLYPVWRCRVCGYLCARDKPPEICPICKAKKERFEKFIDSKPE